MYKTHLCRDWLVYTCIVQEISLKKIYDEVIEDIFDMSNVRIFKEIGKNKKGGCFYFVMFSVS